MKNDFMKILKSFLFNQIDEEVLKSEVEQLQEEYPEVSSYELCDVLITKTSVSAAISGGITGGIPWPLNLLFAVPDFLLLLLFQTKMIMKIAILAGKEPMEDSRFNEVIACMGVSAGAVAGTIGIRKIIENGVSPFLLKMILKQFTKSSSKLIPFFGAIAGTAINISSVIGAGYVARELYFPKDAEITGYKSDNEDEEDKSEENEEDSAEEESKKDDSENNSEEVEEEKEFENEDEAEEKEKVENDESSEDKDEKVEEKEEESKEDSEEESKKDDSDDEFEN